MIRTEKLLAGNEPDVTVQGIWKETAMPSVAGDDSCCAANEPTAAIDVADRPGVDPVRPIMVLLISTYELGHQPFGLASPTAWLREEGATVIAIDLAVEMLDEEAVRSADLVAFYVPMHTATRLATRVLERVQKLNPTAHICFYGLYAPVNESFLRRLGAQTILGGEFEDGLVSLVRRLGGTTPATGAGAGPAAHPPRQAPQPEQVISLSRLQFRTPDRTDLPELAKYAYLDLGNGERRTVGYTEASRGCKKLCRHCPIVPVYNGHFRVVQRDVVLEDVHNQVAAGAQHITFGDPDFFNGPAHALALVNRLHAEHPTVSYDVTIKIEHLLKHAEYLPVLRDTGCLFVTSAVESVDDEILEHFDKRHTREQFRDVVRLFREVGLTLNPTFVTFTPWTTVPGYLDLLRELAGLDLVDNVPPIQYAIRLLIPRGSTLLELPSVQQIIADFDEEALYYPWQHPDPDVDRLYDAVLETVKQAQADGLSRPEVFSRIWQVAADACRGSAADPVPPLPAGVAAASGISRPSPSLSEPWYCCAEPTEEQFAPSV
jgi:radical SAM superfamily enzyme YgiQ (UPF0313 family)